VLRLPRAQAVPAMFGGGIATAFAMKGVQALLSQAGGRGGGGAAAGAAVVTKGKK
jgi:hypothetical protein